MSRNRELADLIAGGFTEADIPNLSASKITSGTFADARLSASSVQQFASTFDDNKIVNDISTLGLRVHTQENLNASNTNSASFDVFQDSSAITNLTGAVRDSGEFISCVGIGEHTSDSNTTCLLHFNNNVTDEKGDISWTANNMTYSTSIKKLGTHSGTFNGSNGNVSANTSAFNYTGDHTIEFWFYMTNTTGERICFEVNNPSSGNQGFLCNYHTDADNKYYTYGGYTSGQSWDLLAPNEDYHIGDPNGSGFANAWHHYAHVKNGNNNQLYLDGVSVASTNDPWTPNVGTTYAYIGGSTGYHGSTAIFQGYIDEFRASSVARYTSNFTPNEVINATGSFEGNAITAASTSKMGAVLTYQDNAGVNALNTDIVLKLSADNGSNYSTATLTALPDFATGIKMCKVNDLSVTAGTQLKYKLEFANQSNSKNARIRGVSLQY